MPRRRSSNSRGSLPPGVDVRGAGGYVIAPGAMLGNRRSYRPIDGQPELAAAFAAKTIPRCRPGSLTLLKPAQQRAQAAATAAAGTVSARERAYAKGALRRIATELAGAPPGTRNNALNKAAFVLGTMAARGWISAQEVEDALTRGDGAQRLCRRQGQQGDRRDAGIGPQGRHGDNPHDDLPEQGIAARRLRQPRAQPHLFFPALPRAVAGRQRQQPGCPRSR